MKKNKKNSSKYIKAVDEAIKIADKHGNGILRISVNVDKGGKVKRYSLAYINYHLCSVDNGRVLGYDNRHGYHHRHYMGKEEPIEFQNYEAIADRFEKEWRKLHEQAKQK